MYILQDTKFKKGENDMEGNYSLSDIAAASGNEGAFGGNGLWIFALLLLLFGFNGFGGRNNDTFAQAQANEILLGQRFDALSASVNKVGDGICSASYANLQNMNTMQSALGNAISSEGRDIQSQLCAINSNIDNKFAAIEKSQLEQRIAEQAQQINSLQTAQMLCGVPKVNPYMYQLTPSWTCGCNNI